MKIKSGIKGFDKIAGGGLPENSITLLVGGPGTGKSLFGLHYAEQAIKEGKKAAYLSFEMNKHILLEQAKGLNIDLQKYEDDGSLILKEYDMTKTNITDIFKDIKKLSDSDNVSRVIIDSISILSMYAEITAGMEVLNALDISPKDFHASPEVLRRGAIMGLINMFRKTNSENVLLIGEMPDGHHYLTRDSFSEFLCDSVIKLTRIESSGKRYLTIVKMRTSDHDLIPQRMDISKNGLLLK